MRALNFALTIVIQFIATLTVAFSGLNPGLKVGLIAIMWATAVIAINTSGRE